MKTSLQTRRRKAISPIIATILVVAMTIVAAGVLYTYFTTTASRAQNTDQVELSGSLVAPGSGSGGNGILAITATNSGSIALTGITASGVCSPATNFGNPLAKAVAPGGGLSDTCSPTAAVTAGESYTETVVAFFANGASQTQVLSLTAQ